MPFRADVRSKEPSPLHRFEVDEVEGPLLHTTSNKVGEGIGARFHLGWRADSGCGGRARGPPSPSQPCHRCRRACSFGVIKAFHGLDVRQRVLGQALRSLAGFLAALVVALGGGRCGGFIGQRAAALQPRVHRPSSTSRCA